MKKHATLSVGLALAMLGTAGQQPEKFNDTAYLQPVEVNAVRASDKMPVAKTNLSKEDIAKHNLGQDLPFILNQTASVVVNADGGNGIGYTGIRIRGTDASRVNVTLNGIPYNDAESQGTFFVNIPDIASSAGSIQVQRGVGTSTNGAGAFGGSINVSTNEVKIKPSLELNSTAGSFHSFKNSLLFSSGIFKRHFTFDGRMSNIMSEGYVDRASSRLQSFYGSLAYVTNSNSLRLNIFTGKEKTYQSWNGVDAANLQANRTYNSAGTEKPGDPYDNETDNYQQTHYQLFYNQKLARGWKANVAVFFTRGAGYYQQYKAKAKLSSYGLPGYNDGSTLVTKTDLIRQLWLDNYFYGSIFSLQYNDKKTQLILGGGASMYDGDHYGKIIWAEVQPAVPQHYRYYYNPAEKNDFYAYGKWTQILGEHFQSFADLQFRRVNYQINGFKTNPSLKVNENYFFINPKAGFTYTVGKQKLYLSYGRAAKEPNREDFENNSVSARPEKLDDFEFGYEFKKDGFSLAANAYYMLYEDQLVLTGKINDVGAYTRSNIPHSYRAGIELISTAQFAKWFSASGNISFSKNKVKNFTEYIDDYDNGGQVVKNYQETNIAFSPNTVAAYSLNFYPVQKLELNIMGKYVSAQYLDNTSNKKRQLDEFYVQDLRAAFRWKTSAMFYLQVNNVFSTLYEPNGYTFSYISGGAEQTENYYFPMSPVYWTLGLNIKL